MPLRLLRQRAALLANIRSFMAERDILEVDVPVMGVSTVTDPHLEAFVTTLGDQPYYLQTSPEYFMKRLLVDGSGDIFYLGKALRCEQGGRYHNPEFTMLEWYRQGMDDRDLAEELGLLLQTLSPGLQLVTRTYAQLFTHFLALDPHTADDQALRALARQKTGFDGQGEPRSTWLDLLFSHCIEPHLQEATLVFDYPVCQSALARCTTNEHATPVARRFELFWRGIELANGYWELNDAAEQRRRFEQDLALRRQLDKWQPTPDSAFLKALERGLPDCAGVALGVDRLLMCLLGETEIAAVLPFSAAQQQRDLRTF